MFCGIWCGSALFTNYPFRGFQTLSSICFRWMAPDKQCLWSSPLWACLGFLCSGFRLPLNPHGVSNYNRYRLTNRLNRYRLINRLNRYRLTNRLNRYRLISRLKRYRLNMYRLTNRLDRYRFNNRLNRYWPNHRLNRYRLINRLNRDRLLTGLIGIGLLEGLIGIGLIIKKKTKTNLHLNWIHLGGFHLPSLPKIPLPPTHQFWLHGSEQFSKLGWEWTQQ